MENLTASKSINVFGIFPGQGSQSVGMGRELAGSSDSAREVFELADQMLGFELSKICFEGPAERLTETAVTQPAILTVSTACFSLFRQCPGAPHLTAAAGHSLGEYSALVAAGALTFEDAVQLVHKRGRYMQEAVPAGKGKMVAVLGKEIEEIETALAGIDRADGVAEVANINAPGQIVVAGDVKGVEQFTELLGNAKIKELPVSAPFHCTLMKPAEDRLSRDLEALPISEAAFPVYANYSAKPVVQPEEIREALRLQVCSRVRWVECVQAATSDFVDIEAVEFGAGKVLSGLMRRIDRELTCKNVASTEDLLRYK